MYKGSERFQWVSFLISNTLYVLDLSVEDYYGELYKSGKTLA